MKPPRKNTYSANLFLPGLFIWGLVLWFLAPDSFQSPDWVKVLISLAPLLLVPLCLKMVERDYLITTLSFPVLIIGSIAFATSFLLPQGWLAALLAGIWLLITIANAFYMSPKKPFHHQWNLTEAALVAGIWYLPIGAAWGVADRLGITPLGFSPIIVLLTVAHFHYAGFLLPVLTSYLLEKTSPRLIRLVGLGVITGIPLVAVGITTSQLSLPVLLETISVMIMALSGAGVALLYIWRVWLKNVWNLPSFLILTGAGCLLTGMVLAFLYGWRFYFPIEWLSIPWMYAVHGTLNAIGLLLLLAGRIKLSLN